MSQLEGGIGADQGIVCVIDVNRQRHIKDIAADVQELDIGFSGIDCAAGSGDCHCSVRGDRDRVIGEGTIGHIGIDAIAAIEQVAACARDEGVIAVIAIEDNAVAAGDIRGIDLIVAGSTVHGDGVGMKRRVIKVAYEGGAVVV